LFDAILKDMKVAARKVRHILAASIHHGNRNCDERRVDSESVAFDRLALAGYLPIICGLFVLI
jgi:hypothetical protein